MSRERHEGDAHGADESGTQRRQERSEKEGTGRGNERDRKIISSLLQL